MTPHGAPPPFPFKDNRILHQGQHVAVVVARTREQAAAAARLVEIEYEEAASVLRIKILMPRSCSIGGTRTSIAVMSPPRWPQPTWSTTRSSRRRR